MKILIAIPVLNEEKELEKNVKILADFLGRGFKYSWEITVVDNGSIDKTQEIGRRMAILDERIKYLRLEERGRGKALKKAWLASDADILSYMDVDLSTNLKSFSPLIDKIINGADISIGSRLMKDSQTTRQLKREIISRAYNFLIKLMFNNKFSDAQCGFKAITKEAANELLSKVVDNKWFLDTELLLLAEKNGYKIAEVPVEWIEDLDSRVNIIKTAIDDIQGLIRLKINFTRKKKN